MTQLNLTPLTPQERAADKAGLDTLLAAEPRIATSLLDLWGRYRRALAQIDLLEAVLAKVDQRIAAFEIQRDNWEWVIDSDNPGVVDAIARILYADAETVEVMATGYPPGDWGNVGERRGHQYRVLAATVLRAIRERAQGEEGTHAN